MRPDKRSGTEGANSLASMLLIHAPLTNLDLTSKISMLKQICVTINDAQQYFMPTHEVNEIGVEGARKLSEALKNNTTLTTLNLMSVLQQQDDSKQIARHQQKRQKQGTRSAMEERSH